MLPFTVCVQAIKNILSNNVLTPNNAYISALLPVSLVLIDVIQVNAAVAGVPLLQNNYTVLMFFDASLESIQALCISVFCFCSFTGILFRSLNCLLEPDVSRKEEREVKEG